MSHSNLIAGGTSSRRQLRSRKGLEKEDDSFFSGKKQDVEELSKQARMFYRAKTGATQKRPMKVLEHDDFGAQGRHYKLLWRDVGYGGQDIEEWYPANFAKTFEGLVENYLKVSQPLIFPRVCSYTLECQSLPPVSPWLMPPCCSHAGGVLHTPAACHSEYCWCCTGPGGAIRDQV